MERWSGRNSSCYMLNWMRETNIHIFRKICSPTTQEINGKILWWGNYTDEESDWYLSEPLCLNENYTIINRKCENDTWDPEPLCFIVQPKFSPCPEDFTYHEESEICYITVSNQTFPPSCPYTNVISFYDYAFLIGNDIPGPVWYPATRFKDYGVGHLVVREPTRYYGSLVTVKYSWKGSFYKDCLIAYSSTSFEMVHCQSRYDAVCAYKSLRYLTNTYCSKNVHEQCYYSDYNLNISKCFCIKEPTENCNALAELKKPYQNFILPTKHNNCRIGLELEENFFWTNSKEKLSYTNWNRRTDFRKRYGVLTEDNSWSLENESEISCVLCEENTTYENIQLSLALDIKNKQLTLIVDNPKDLYIPPDSDGIFCFTDTSASTSSHPYTVIKHENYEIINDTRIKYYFSYSTNCPGHYWCQVFAQPNLDMIQTDRLLVFDEDIYGNEFVTTIVVKYNDSMNPTSSAFYTTIYDSIQEHLSSGNESLPFFLRWVSIVNLNETSQTIDYLVHMTSKDFTNVEEEFEEFEALIASTVGKVAAIHDVSNFRSVSYCLPENTVSNGISLQWPLTKINSTVTPEEFCLHEDGFPVTRTCAGDFLSGAYWAEIIGTCSDDPRQSSITAQLYQLVQSNASLTVKSNSLVELTKDVSEYIPVDIHYIAEILDKAEKEDVSSVENVTVVIDNIIGTQKSTLKQSQEILNSTDRILYNFDILLQNFIEQPSPRFIRDTIAEIITKNLMVFVFDAKQTNVRGIAVYNRSQEREILKLRDDVSYADFVNREGLEVATYIPQSLIEQINQTLDDNQPLTVIITVFLNDYLFNEYPSNDSREPYKSVFGILLPTINEKYRSPIKIIYNFTDSGLVERCAFWRYGYISNFENTKGEWDLQDEPTNGNHIRVCDFEHTTHFALLILADVSLDEQASYAKHNTILHIITSIESALSVFGIFWIFLTAFLFKRWRQNKGNQILLHYSIVTLLQLTLLFMSNDARNSGSAESLCICIGVSLHYIVLSQFCWMLIMAVLHYQRFVLVFEKPQRWILLKSCLFGYGLPLLPVIINLSTLTPLNYVQGNTGMCYPTGDGFTIWLLIPVLVIASINLIFFCVIIWNIFHEKMNDMYGHDFILVLKLRLVVVLFSLLGISWVFGFASEFLSSVIFAYLFTITVGIQGFVLFLAFIALNESTRNMYLVLFLKTYKYRKW
ncbi:hypothetical protein Trydic_g2228 [Trypoxylus dichotomus]